MESMEALRIMGSMRSAVEYTEWPGVLWSAVERRGVAWRILDWVEFPEWAECMVVCVIRCEATGSGHPRPPPDIIYDS